jgi:cytidylate kinase
VNLISGTSAIYLITGPMAAGKSTVARLLAERFERSVYLEGDFFRRSIVSGRVEMTPDASREAVEQLRLRYRLAAAAADAYEVRQRALHNGSIFVASQEDNSPVGTAVGAETLSA